MQFQLICHRFEVCLFVCVQTFIESLIKIFEGLQYTIDSTPIKYVPACYNCGEQVPASYNYQEHLPATYNCREHVPATYNCRER